MLGLRPENDQGYYQSIQRTTPQFKKSAKFANQLTGRFFVSGISGSFAKHQKHVQEIKEHEVARQDPPVASDKLEDNTGNNNIYNNNNSEENDKPSVIPIRFLPHKKLVRKYTYQPVLEKRQREELRRDAQRLLELEEKLNEIQRIKSLKRQRDRQRRKRKVEYLAATSIQRTFRGFSVRSKQRAAAVLTDFLRSVQANQAIVKFLAALSIVKKFMKKKFPAWQKKHFLRKQAKEVAEDNWLIVSEVASILTAARREVARDFLDTVFEISTENVMPQLKEEKKRRDKLKKNKSKRKKKGKGMKNAEDFLQFFLTEFDRNADGTASDDDDEEDDDDDNEEEEERSLEELEQDYQAFQRFTATLRSQPYSLHKAGSSSNINLHQSSRYLAAFPPHFQPQSKKKQYDLNDAKIQQLVQRHQQLVNKMEEEQQRRKTLLERKRSALTYDQQKKLEEEKKKHQKKKLKEDFLKKLEDEASRRQQFQQRLREVKERKAAEIASQQRETLLMGKEDVFLIQKKLREVQLQRERIFAASNNVNNNNSKKPKSASRSKVVVTEPSQPTKKAPVPKVPHRPVEANKKPAEDKIMAAVMHVAVSEEEKARYTELLSKRIKEAKQQKLLEKQQEEQQEQEKKEKLEKFLQRYQQQLKEQKIAMKLKKKEERRLKREKERKEAEGVVIEGEEKGKDDSEEEDGDEVLAHVISSAPEEFKNIMEDFQFDDFMEKPDLIQIYSEDSPKHDDAQAFPTDIIPSLPSPDVIDYKQSNHFQATPNIPQTTSQPSLKKKTVTTKTKPHKTTEVAPTREQSIKRFYKINRDIFRMPRHLKSTPYFQHYVKYVKETENIPIEQILSREGGEREKKRGGGEKTGRVSPRVEGGKDVSGIGLQRENEKEDDEEEEEHGLLEMIQRAQEKKYGTVNPTRQQQQQQAVIQSNKSLNTPTTTSTTQPDLTQQPIHKSLSQPSLPNTSEPSIIPATDVAMNQSLSTNQLTSSLTVKAPVLKFTPSLPIPTIPTLNSLLTPHPTSSNLPHPTSEAFPVQSLPAPPLETMLNIKQRYGISIDDFATHLPTANTSAIAAGNHVSTIKKLKMKKLKQEKEQKHHLTVKNDGNKVKKEKNKEKKKSTGPAPNTLIIPIPRQMKPQRKEVMMEGVMEVEGEDEEEGEGHSLAYSHDTLSVNIPSRQRKLSKRYTTPLAPLSSAINTNPATTTSASSKKKRKESFPTSEEKGAVNAIKKELQEEQSKVKQKISELFDYEQQLQKDYADLKKQFQEKLQHAMMTSSSKGRGEDEEEEMEGGSLLEIEVNEEEKDLEGGEESSDSLLMMAGKRQEEVEREDEIMRKSITESYSEQIPYLTSSQPKVSTKDLLMEWAIEDAIEKGEINDDDLIALHQQKQLKYSEQGDDNYGEGEDYEREEEEEGADANEDEEFEGEDEEEEEENNKLSGYDDDSYYDRRLNSLRGSSNNPSKPSTALSLTHHTIAEEEEEDEENGEYDEEEGSFDADEDEEEYMRDERKEYWKQLLSLDQTAAVSSSSTKNNVTAQTATQLDDYCLSMMNNLNSKIGQK